MDLNVRAFRTVQTALSEVVVPDKRKAAARKGGLRGGASRAASLSPERRREIAMKANASRWKHKKSAD